MKIVVDVAVSESALAALRGTRGVEVTLIEPPEERTREIEADKIRDAEILFCTFPPSNSAVMRSLKWIQIASTGYSQLFPHDLPGRGIRASNARGCFDVPIAEWNVAMMVNLLRDVRQMIRHQDAAVWDRSATFQKELRGLTVGIWGYGGIGRETARLAKQMGLRVRVMTRSGAAGPRGNIYAVAGTGDEAGKLPDRIYGPGAEQSFLKDLDFLVVALPLTPATEGIIGARELQALPRHAYVLNPARGPIIQEKAMISALEEKWIAGAALDTHYHYPLPASHPLWKFPNVILTPHISGSSLSPKFKERVWDIFGQNFPRYLRGEPLLNELTAEQLSGK